MKAAEILPFHFLVMTIFGAWCPAHWSKLQKYLRNLYTLIGMAVMFGLGVLELGQLVFVELTLDEFNDTFYVFIATCAACFKFTYYATHRDRVSRLIDMFQVESCNVCDDFERKIKDQYDADCKALGKELVLLVNIAALMVVLVPLFDGASTRRLPHVVLQLYSLSPPVAYWLTYAHHAWATFLVANTNIVTDAIVAGFMMQLCGQFDLMAHRLHQLPLRVRQMRSAYPRVAVETVLLDKSVQHHVHIYRTAESIVETFKGVIIVQFYASTLQICLSVYQLAFRSSNLAELICYAGFLACMLCTLAIYCYSGNELTAKSLNFCDEIFNVDWTELTICTKRNLAFMILRSSKPIEISDGAFVRLTMQTFASVVKVSYSTFSFIKSSR